MKTRTEQRNWLGLALKVSALASAILLLVVAFGSRLDYTAEAATVIVNVGQTNGGGGGANEFNSAEITITEGDTIDFVWFADYHDVRSYASSEASPDWASPATSTPYTFSQQFNTVGVFTYYCETHNDWDEAAPGVIDANIAGGEMVGKVTVIAAVLDETGPVTSSAAVAPSPTDGAASSTLTATVVPARRQEMACHEPGQRWSGD